MRFVVAGGGVAGLAAALLLARSGHEADVLERDAVEPGIAPQDAFASHRAGIPHFFQPHAFLPRGRRELIESAPDVHEDLLSAGAEPQDIAARLHGPRAPGDEDLVYLWVRRPLVEWALRRAAAAEAGVRLRSGVEVTGLVAEDGRAAGVTTASGERIAGDVVVDALGRYRTPAGWHRVAGQPTDSGAIYYCRYFRLAPGAEHLEAPLLNPRGDLGYMGFNTFRGDNRTYAVILLVPATDRELRRLRDEHAWTAACAAVPRLDELTHPSHGEPITGVMPMGGLMNVLRTGDPGIGRLVAVGDALCHTDPAFAYGLSLAIVHARALADAAAHEPDAVADAYRAAVTPEAAERYELACATDAARSARWNGAQLDFRRRDGCYPLFAFAGALAAAPHDDDVLRRTIGRVGLLDRVAAFDDDTAVHERIEAILADPARAAPPAGPARAELVAGLAATGGAAA